MLTILMSASILPATAQRNAGGLNPSNTHFLLGIKAGADFTQEQGSHLQDDFSGYFVAGAYIGVRLNKIRIKGEALFSQESMTTGAGFKDAFHQYISENGQHLKEGTFKMQTLSVPILVGLNIIPNILWIEAGPQYTAIVSIKDANDFVTDVQSVVKNGYVAGVAGVSLSLPLHLNLSVRYIFGVSNRNNTDVPIHWSSNHIQATVGLGFL